jgi:lysophospholipase L1-like esterase
VTASQPPAGAPDIAAFMRTGRRPQTTQLVVCAGDSLTRGRSSANWVEILQPRFAPGGYELVNAGIDGDLAWNVLARIGDVVHCEPDIVTLLVGTNDVIATYSAFLEKMYRRLQCLPHAPAPLLGPDLRRQRPRRPDRPRPPERPRGRPRGCPGHGLPHG